MIDIVDAQAELSAAGRDDLAILVQDKLDEIACNREAIAELVDVLKEYVDFSREHDIGGGDVVIATCESREHAVEAITKHTPNTTKEQ